MNLSWLFVVFIVLFVLYYLEMVKQLQPFERSTKESFKDERGTLVMTVLKIRVSIRICIQALVSKEMD